MAAVNTWTAFSGESRLAAGSPADVVAAVKAASDKDGSGLVQVFDDATGRQVDLDLRGNITDALSRLPSSGATDENGEPQTRGPGRPKLGVVAREVTLLPRHWDWLSEQPGGASVVLRKLVDAARAANVGNDRVRRAREATDRFMAAMAGNQPGYEEAARALYAGYRIAFEQKIEAWPDDIRNHVLHLGTNAFDDSAED